MPYGIPVGTVAIGETGAKNAALYAASIMSLKDKDIAKRLSLWRSKQTQSVKLKPKN
jgi:5-(carboxyamino)imidazole ribonucleotide mutase